MTEKRYDKNNPRFRDEFGCVNDLLTGESYLCGESGFIGDRDARYTAIALCDLLNDLHNENEQLKSFKQRVFDLIDKTIEEETQIAENIEEVTQETRPYAKAVNRLTIKTLENLKWELQE